MQAPRLVVTASFSYQLHMVTCFLLQSGALLFVLIYVGAAVPPALLLCFLPLPRQLMKWLRGLCCMVCWCIALSKTLPIASFVLHFAGKQHRLISQIT